MSRISESLRRGYNSVNGRLSALVVGGSVLVASNVQAALPAEADAAFTAISTAVTDVLAAAWPILAIAVGGFITMKLVRKGAKAAT